MLTSRKSGAMRRKSKAGKFRPRTSDDATVYNSAFLIVGPGSIFVGFMPCRLTSAMSENYFVWLVRMGGLVLGFYVVLAALQHFGMQWYTALNGACGPVAATFPSPVLGGAPIASAAVSCTKAIGVNDLLTLFFCILILTLVGLALPLVLASMAGHGVDMTLENLASAKYLTSGAARQLSNGMHFLGHQISRMMHQSQQQTTLNQRMEGGAAAAARTASSTPGSSGGSPPPGGGWNGRPSGPPIAPPPAGPDNSGPGGSPAGLTYQPQPGRPGHQTRAEAVDITNLQGGNRG
jgi:hypothetical protein